MKTSFWGKLVPVGLILIGFGLAPLGTAAPNPVPTPSFTEVSAELGLVDVYAFRIGIADVNGDRYPDLLIHLPCKEYPPDVDVMDKQCLYLNVPGDNPSDPHDRKFIDFTEESNIRANREGTQDGRHSSSGIFVDVDNDGDLDLFTIVYIHDNEELPLQGTNELMLNDGQGHFTLAPNSPFHTESRYNTPSAVFLEIDNDGFIDLFIGNWYIYDVLTQDYLYQGHGDGSFTNVTSTCGIEGFLTSIYAVAAFDWNGDGYMDIFEPSYSHTRPNAKYYHWQNNGDGTFTDVTEQSQYGIYGGYESGRSSFGSMPGDYDNDGDVDFIEVWTHGRNDGDVGRHTTVVTNIDNVCVWDFWRVAGRIDEDPAILHHGDHFAHFFDIENDGLQDFTLTESGYDNNRIYIFKQEPDHTFHPVTMDSGLWPINEADLPPANASPFDYDLDGDDDLAVGFAGSAGMHVYRNDVGTLNNWLTVRVEGAGRAGRSNRSAIGARVSVSTQETTCSREVYSCNGHQSPQIPYTLRFGLGSAEKVDTIRVNWPNEDRSETVLTDVAVNQFITIYEESTDGAPDNDGVRLQMPGTYFSPGDVCSLSALLYNSGPDPIEDAMLFIILDVYGMYFFYPTWSEMVNWGTVDLPAGVRYLPVIPEFHWPDTGASAADGLVFWGGALDATGTELIGDLDGLSQWMFSFGP
ncbi:CRTAC1 family protein [bacterium]|nr:CRTAC1 family protein [candidate division CSSED10-310 bacterium]